MSEQWPTWATQAVEIRAWNPTWQQEAIDLIGDLGARLEPWLGGCIEHVGSTAVPNLAAKPIIDLMAPVASLSESGNADRALAEAGWHLVPPELDGRPWRRMYVLPDGDRRTAHLHLVESGHPRWHEALRFRNQLRQHPELAEKYARLKRIAAEVHRRDRDAYTEAKSAFVREVIRDAI